MICTNCTKKINEEKEMATTISNSGKTITLCDSCWSSLVKGIKKIDKQKKQEAR